MKVLIVDDSVVFRSQIKAALSGSPLIEVVGVASDGKIAIEKMKAEPVDLITLDLEMPRMNGLETIREMKKLKLPTRVIVFASRTKTGTEMALDALKEGADDFIAKPANVQSIEDAQQKISQDLVPKILQFANSDSTTAHIPNASAGVLPANLSFKKIHIESIIPRVILIGCSTGGPTALETLFAGLKGPLPCPILIVQHMPPGFTTTLARRIEAISKIPCEEAKQWAKLSENKIYIAPGDYHMRLHQKADDIFLKLDQGPQRHNVRPAVDNLFESATPIYGDKVVAFVLTGMGEDGLQGVREIKRAGGGVMIQDKASCVVFGMPGAIFNDGCFDKIGNLQEIQTAMAKLLQTPVRLIENVS